MNKHDHSKFDLVMGTEVGRLEMRRLVLKILLGRRDGSAGKTVTMKAWELKLESLEPT